MTAPAEPRSGGEAEEQEGKRECRGCGVWIDYEDREPTGACWPCELEELRAEIARLRSPAWTSEAPKVLLAADRALSAAREMLGVFEDNGGHDGLRGEGYRAVLDQIDDCRSAIRPILPPATPEGAS